MKLNRNVLFILLVLAAVIGCCEAQDRNYGITETANDLGDLSTFTKAVDQAGLTDKLNNKGALTLRNHTFIVFAPNDAAFRSLPSETLNSIMGNKDDLETLLNYHIIEDANVDDIANLRDVNTLKTLDGKDVNLSYNNGLIVDGARVLDSRKYSQGIIYVIDKVLLPDDNNFLDKYNLRGFRTGLATAVAADRASRADETDRANALARVNASTGNNRTVVYNEAANAVERRAMSAAESNFLDSFKNEKDLRTFARALAAADLGRDFYNRTNLTMFAPNDQAFSAIAENRLNDLLNNRDDLRTLLRYHIIDRSNLTDWNTTRGSVGTLQGRDLMIDRNDGEFTVNNATVVRTKYYNNSIIYVIDRILLPDDRNFLDKYQLTDLADRYKRGMTTITGDEEDDTALPPQPTPETNRTKA